MKCSHCPGHRLPGCPGGGCQTICRLLHLRRSGATRDLCGHRPLALRPTPCYTAISCPNSVCWEHGPRVFGGSLRLGRVAAWWRSLPATDVTVSAVLVRSYECDRGRITVDLDLFGDDDDIAGIDPVGVHPSSGTWRFDSSKCVSPGLRTSSVLGRTFRQRRAGPWQVRVVLVSESDSQSRNTQTILTTLRAPRSTGRPRNLEVSIDVDKAVSRLPSAVTATIQS